MPSDERPYKIRNNSFVLKDGNAIPLKSYFIPKTKDGAFPGYRMLNWISEPKEHA